MSDPDTSDPNPWGSRALLTEPSYVLLLCSSGQTEVSSISCQHSLYVMSCSSWRRGTGHRPQRSVLTGCTTPLYRSGSLSQISEVVFTISPTRDLTVSTFPCLQGSLMPQPCEEQLMLKI